MTHNYNYYHSSGSVERSLHLNWSLYFLLAHSPPLNTRLMQASHRTTAANRFALPGSVLLNISRYRDEFAELTVSTVSGITQPLHVSAETKTYTFKMIWLHKKIYFMWNVLLCLPHRIKKIFNFECPPLLATWPPCSGLEKEVICWCLEPFLHSSRDSKENI